ncbi:MAG TPA: hypothetical protein PLT95_07420 [Agitococcus sp.]|nr:hypothetical protein [Agitococcus sp.]HNC02089.1 hypothetical protein [Agitococcus sp.]HNC86723.1 hypothetical protein [Agitococcus sp.]HRH91712.1 hypothetical protein [Agitococcus sp.]
MSKTLTRLEALKDLVQQAIDTGATSVEQIHKTIAALPLAVLEKQGLLDVDSEKRDELWDKSFGQVYEAIRRVNQEVGELATQAFEAIEDQMIIQKNIAEAEAAEAAKQKIESPVAVEPKSKVV